MQKLSFISNLVKSKCAFTRPSEAMAAPAAVWRHLGLRSCATEAPQSTEAESQATQSTETESQEQAIDPFLRPSSTGLCYGRLTGTSRLAMKNDVIHLLDGYNLTVGDIKFDYNKAYEPLGMLLQFQSSSLLDSATKFLSRNGRVCKLEKVDRFQWDSLISYDGKAVLLHGIPINATFEDIERFLSGSDYVGSSMQLAFSPGSFGGSKMAYVEFFAQTGAAAAVRVKNRGFCLNAPISMRLLY